MRGDRDSTAIPGTIVVAPDTSQERSTPVYDWIVVGRECPGVDERHRLLVDDPVVSRSHVELWLDHDRDQAWLTDRSTNGTRLNGQRIERSTPTPIKPGDRVRLGDTELQFRSRRFTGAAPAGARETVRQIAVTDMVMVVGDIVSFSSIAEYTDDRVLLENIDRLYAELRRILARHRGTLSSNR
jgi:adenylate cyclase